MRNGFQVSEVCIRTSDGTMLVERAEAAVKISDRCRGLIGRDELPEGRGMLLIPCRAVHTCFMRFKLDLIFFSRDFRIVRAVRNIGPWRFVHGGRSAWGVLEVQSGWLPWHPPDEEDRLVITDMNGNRLIRT